MSASSTAPRQIEQPNGGVASESSGTILPLLSMLLVAVVWGATYSQIKQAVSVYPVFALLALRFALASLALGPVVRRRRASTAGFALPGIALGIVLATGYALQTLGLERISATATGFSTSLFLPLTPLLAAGLFGERIRRRGWFATGLASFGLVLLAGGNRGPLGANLLVLGGAVCFAGHLVLTGRVARSHDPTRLALAQMATCAMVFGVVAVASEPLEPPRGVSLWAAIVVTGVFASALGFAVQTWAQRRMTATQTAIVIGAEPVSAGVVGVAFGGESLGPAATIGCIAILAAIVTGCRCR